MHTRKLFEIYEDSLKNTSGLEGLVSEADLEQAITKKKYDLQDLALIEVVMNDDEKQFHESLKENYEALSADLTKKNGPATETDPLKEQLLEIFISNLNYYIDLFYNSLLNRHFAGG